MDTYAARLRHALDRDGWSQLRLVKALAERTGNAVDSERSAVRGYLQGNLPRPARAKLIAEITEDPALAQVEDPRRSGAARIEDHLEQLATEVARLERSHVQIHEKLDRLLGAVEDGFQQQQARSRRRSQK